MIEVGIVGGAGYIGGELLRILLGHPEVKVVAATSASAPGRRVDRGHPNLRGVTDLAYVAPDELPDCDVVFFSSSGLGDLDARAKLMGRAKVVYDLSPDLRFADAADYRQHFGVEHPAPELLGTAVFGSPELNRDELRTADHVTVPGCMATAATLALYPLAAEGLLRGEVTVDGRIGSSGSGATAGEHNLHAERAGMLRVFAPADHRHQVEIAQATGLSVRMTGTGIDAVRGIQVVCRADAADGVTEASLRAAYRKHYAEEPFVRVVTYKRGNYRYPEPKILIGSNHCDVGFALSADGRGVVAMAAIDNLVKGGAGNAVQCLNIRMGWPERTGLGFTGLHPS